MLTEYTAEIGVVGKAAQKGNHLYTVFSAQKVDQLNVFVQAEGASAAGYVGGWMTRENSDVVERCSSNLILGLLGNIFVFVGNFSA